MKRQVAIVFVLAVLAGGSPARATHQTWSKSGTVLLPVWHPTATQLAYDRSTSVNGRLGYVIDLPADADGASYTLTRSSGLGIENLDVFFYESIDSTLSEPFGQNCTTEFRSRDDEDVEQGTICPGAHEGNWAIVTIRGAGVDVDFTFSYRRPHGA